MATYQFAEQLAVGEAWRRIWIRSSLRSSRWRSGRRRWRSSGRGSIGCSWRSGRGRSIRLSTRRTGWREDGECVRGDGECGRTGKPGWAVASQARYLVYLVTEPETIYFIAMRRVRSALPRWKAMCAEARTE